MGNRAWQGSKVTEVRVDVDRVVVARGLRVWFVGGGGSEGSGEVGVGQHIWAVKKDWLVLRDAVTLQVGGDWIADRDAVSVINGGNRNESLKLIANIDLASDVHRGISRLILVCGLSLNAENELGARRKGLRVIVPFEPLLGLKNANSRGVIQLDEKIRLVNNLESVFVVGEATTIQG